MDFQNRAGSKPGSGGVAGGSESNIDRRERLRKLALETIDLAKDPYFMKNHLGSYECKLCLTLHNNEGSYLAHTQGKKHQTNLARRAAKDAHDTQNVATKDGAAQMGAAGMGGVGTRIVPKKVAVKIGRPGYKVTKIRDPMTRQLGLLFQIQYPETDDGIRPRHRFMSAYEQRQEEPNKAFQYLLFAAEPYETIAFKVQSKEIDKTEGRFWTFWDPDARQFHLQFFFKTERPGQYGGGAPGAGVMDRGRAAMMGMSGPPPGLNPLNPFGGAPPLQPPTFVNQ
ncbi:hypothetical protein DFJ77DRAFT_470016 [Powellomyces hirtus]|nr:hypothetical protein DFJ77DRAFT_470016 [Powellomyces hirtus]